MEQAMEYDVDLIDDVDLLIDPVPLLVIVAFLVLVNSVFFIQDQYSKLCNLRDRVLRRVAVHYSLGPLSISLSPSPTLSLSALSLSLCLFVSVSLFLYLSLCLLNGIVWKLWVGGYRPRTGKRPLRTGSEKLKPKTAR